MPNPRRHPRIYCFFRCTIRCRPHWWPLPRALLLIRLSQRDLLVTRRWKSFSSKQGPFWTVIDIEWHKFSPPLSSFILVRSARFRRSYFLLHALFSGIRIFFRILWNLWRIRNMINCSYESFFFFFLYLDLKLCCRA